ncbi:hypothetical protein WJX74_006644 [Apatococcus lobatus]|uniref:monogalactosyldiacylglycerol synthase n=2 Tax=Apatococcus TaxID=904362 RepID=A0AAW1SVF2_9CHLO
MSASVDPLSGIAPLSWASGSWTGPSGSLLSPTVAAQSSDQLLPTQQRNVTPCQAFGGKRSGGSGARRSKKGSVDLRLAGPSDRSRVAQRLLRAAGLGAGVGGGSFFVGNGPAHALRLWPFPSGKRKARDPKDRKRILILMSDTGGGHRASAEAIRTGFQELYGNEFHVDIVDLWTNYTKWPFNQLPKSYSFLVKNSFLWRLGYYFQQPRIVHVPVQRFAAAWVGSEVSKAFDQYQPDLCVSVHPLMQTLALRVLRSRIRGGLQRPIPFATVVTDLTTCHNVWFNPNVTRCFVATPEARKLALHMGLKDHQVVVHGLPIRPAFSHRFPSQRKLRKHLGMDRDLPAVMLVGGGEGMGPVEKTVDAIAAQLGSKCQLIVIAGRNKKLVKRLQRKQYPPGMKVVINGFVDNMPEWMTAADTIVTKAGPGTIAESLICNLPILLNDFVPCQEHGNVPWVIDNGVGAFDRDPVTVARILSDWFTVHRKQFDVMVERTKKLAAPNALFKIVADLAELAQIRTVARGGADGVLSLPANWNRAEIQGQPA